MTERPIASIAAERLDQLGVDYFITGSVATISYGETRYTSDVDIVVLLQPRHIDDFCELFPPPDFSLDRYSIELAVKSDTGFTVLHLPSAQRLDIILPANTDFNESRFSARRRQLLPGGATGWVASPEHVILKKMEFFNLGASEKHLRDITGVLVAQGGAIDRPYIEMMAGRMGTLEVWQAITQKLRDEGRE